MTKRTFFIRCLAVLFVSLLFAACGFDTGSTGGSGDSGNTPTTVSPTPSPSPSPTPSPTPATSTDYAFVRNHQVWVSMRGAQPVQATHFDKILDPPGNVFYSRLLWFDNDHYLAFMLNVLNFGIGGNVCDVQLTYARERAIFILHTDTMQITSVRVAGDQDTYSGGGIGGDWEFLFVEDATHLLAWHSAVLMRGETSKPGLYRIDVTTNISSLVVPASDMPVTTRGALYTMRYNNGQLYYEVPAQSSQQSPTTFTIYRHSISQPDVSSVKVMDIGTEYFCIGGGGQPNIFYTRPGWDISPDGKYLVAQTWSGSDLTHLTGKIQLLNLQNNTVSSIFSQVPAAVLSSDVAVRWSPDSQTVLLAQQANPRYTESASLYSMHVTQPDSSTSYQTSASQKYDLNDVSWNANSSSFAFYGSTKVFSFTVDQPAGQEQLGDAGLFAWGQQ